MPCLTRVAISSGAGVGLVSETHAGSAPLARRLLPLLDRLDAFLGPGGEVGRLTVVDSEVGNARMMFALHHAADRIFITVVKGQVLKEYFGDLAMEWRTFIEQLLPLRDSPQPPAAGADGPAPRGLRRDQPAAAPARRAATRLRCARRRR